MGLVKRSPWRWLIPLGVLAMSVLASLACLASSRELGGFNVRESFTLNPGERRDGDKVIVANSINLMPGSQVDGSATLIGNQVALDATVSSDAVVIAKNLDLGGAANVAGDLVLCVDNLNQNAGARIGGEVRYECNESGKTSVAKVAENGLGGWQDSFSVRLGSLIVGALFFGGLSALAVAILPRHLIYVSRSIRHSPAVTGGVGCLTILVAIGLSIVYVLSLLLVLPLALLPFVMVAWLVLGLASLFGWLALAEPTGRLLFRVLNLDAQPPLITAAIGGVTLALLVRIWTLFWMTGWITMLATVILGSIGLGAVVLTRLGTQPYPQKAKTGAA
ncbi:MAG: hypothetical protein GXY36_03365 [Chloroflexi bacterium]|nr:hypothetical protein [Chloroflexota bacterium]